MTTRLRRAQGGLRILPHCRGPAAGKDVPFQLVPLHDGLRGSGVHEFYSQVMANSATNPRNCAEPIMSIGTAIGLYEGIVLIQ